jgi:ssDNA-binding Zn-finger/Zn-ribbon topoisomerase 1
MRRERERERERVPEDLSIARTCPDCGGDLKVKTNTRTGHQFLGCERFATTRCGYTEEIPESIRMRLAGAAMLPGLD